MGNILPILESVDFSLPEMSRREEIRYTYNNHPVPRVTEILSKMIHKDALMYWANSLGFKGLRYKDVLNQAANTGTAAHSAIENFLMNKIESKDNIPFLGFLAWYNNLINLNLKVEVLFVEHRLSCQWFGGTLDALIKIDNRVFLIDFKTSNHVTFNYFLQLGAYRFMLRNIESIDVDGVIVLQLDKEEPGFNEYLLNFNIPQHLSFMDHCEETFLSLVLAYYHIEKAEFLYKDIF